MSALNLTVFLATLATLATAAPAADTISSNAALVKRKDCSFSGAVDVSTIATQAPTCATITFNAIQVPGGKTLDLSKLADGTTVHFTGTSVWGVQKGFAGPLLNIGGKSITVTSDRNARLDGQGAQYWDGQGSNGATAKPKFLALHSLTGTSVVNDLYLLNTPVQAVSINGCDGLHVNRMHIDNKASNDLPANKAAHNTDGFDIGASSNIVIDGAVVDNQDDCVAVNSGTGITFQNGKCTGGHGLSIGSVGHGSTAASNTVNNVNFLSSTVASSVNGIRVKSFYDGTGSIGKVTFKSITLQSISKYGVLIEQNYDGGDLSKTHGPGTGVPLTGLTLDTIIGGNSVASSGTNVAIECANCSGWTWTGVNVSGGGKFACVGKPSVVPAGVCA